jgi:preprotein translocase subunit SecE
MKNILIGTKDFLKEVNMELKRVNWPNKKETIKYTLVVIATLTIVAMYLGIIDFLLSRGLNELIK